PLPYQLGLHLPIKIATEYTINHLKDASDLNRNFIPNIYDISMILTAFNLNYFEFTDNFI
ncbi:MAG: hypothetical protein KAT54_09150, partial [Candidatus Marinimicrobia bacterium]|nr:hypothetical protein [Candidatus Neomarinimicrobiota bacterium]